MFNEMIILAKEEKSKKKGGSLAAIFKLIQDLTVFEENIQECIDAQEMTQNKGTIEGFVNEIDKMYEALFNIAKSGVQVMRSERNKPVVEDVEDVEKVVEDPILEPSPAPSIESSSTFSANDLKKQLETKPSAPITLTVPQTPKM
jgi:hypothetical protein